MIFYSNSMVFFHNKGISNYFLICTQYMCSHTFAIQSIKPIIFRLTVRASLEYTHKTQKMKYKKCNFCFQTYTQTHVHGYTFQYYHRLIRYLKVPNVRVHCALALSPFLYFYQSIIVLH